MIEEHSRLSYRLKDLCVLGMGRPWPSQVLDQLNSLLLHQLAARLCCLEKCIMFQGSWQT